MQSLLVLGATGSIGASTLAVVAAHPEKFRVFALTANNSAERMAQLCCQFLPRYAVMVDDQAAMSLSRLLKAANCSTEVLAGANALVDVAQLPEVDIVMAAIVGAAGLLPTLAAARSGKRILLANKEALVMSGSLLLEAVRSSGASLLPIDSEHNAIFQCLPFAAYGQNPERCGVEKIVLTASGGPFLHTPFEQLSGVTPDQACAHPTWNMGRKISVDSATLMNKGLEVIEASLLFNARPDQIEVLIHPQSIVHSMVRYVDGSVLAQMGNPDMRTPIAHALSWPERIVSGVSALDLAQHSPLHFHPVDRARFPCLDLAFQVLRAGGNQAAVLNAANEIAVYAFLRGELSYTAIAEVIHATLDHYCPESATDVPALLLIDAEARRIATTYVTTYGIS